MLSDRDRDRMRRAGRVLYEAYIDRRKQAYPHYRGTAKWETDAMMERLGSHVLQAGASPGLVVRVTFEIYGNGAQINHMLSEAVAVKLKAFIPYVNSQADFSITLMLRYFYRMERAGRSVEWILTDRHDYLNPFFRYYMAVAMGLQEIAGVYRQEAEAFETTYPEYRLTIQKITQYPQQVQLYATH